MSDASQCEWRFYLDYMINFAGKVLAYADGLDQASFVASKLNSDSTLRKPEPIDEVVTHMLNIANHEAPSTSVKCFRNVRKY